MVFVKVVKDRTFFAKYQVKYRRRREGKTDYQARRRMVIQDKNKYNTPKYRIVVRFTNTDVIAQLVSSKIQGDFVHVAAYGHELTKYGVPVGHCNYASAYAVGLLLARRALTKFGIGERYQGLTKITGEDFNVEPVADGPRPLHAILDTGLKRTSTGSKVFATLKGAADGGVDIPHSVRRYVGYDAEAKKLKTDVLRQHIFGIHVANHMKSLREENSAAYQKKFSRYIKNNIGPDDVEKIYTKAHAAIRADPKPAPKKPENPELKHKKYFKFKSTRQRRLGMLKVRKRELALKKAAEEEAAAEAEEGDESDE